MIKDCSNTLTIKLSPVGGGGNPLRAWVLARFDIVSDCFNWFLGCFNNKLCIKMHTTNIVLNLPTCKVKGVLVNLITPHLILQNINKLGSRAPLEDDVSIHVINR